MAQFFADGVYRIGGGVSVPRLLTSQAPEYSADSRAARIEGSIELLATIGEDGVPRDLQVHTALGYGLDEKAIECVRKWRFRPGVLNGDPVPVAANLVVQFKPGERAKRCRKASFK